MDPQTSLALLLTCWHATQLANPDSPLSPLLCLTCGRFSAYISAVQQDVSITTQRLNAQMVLTAAAWLPPAQPLFPRWPVLSEIPPVASPPIGALHIHDLASTTLHSINTHQPNATAHLPSSSSSQRVTVRVVTDDRPCVLPSLEPGAPRRLREHYPHPARLCSRQRVQRAVEISVRTVLPNMFRRRVPSPQLSHPRQLQYAAVNPPGAAPYLSLPPGVPTVGRLPQRPPSTNWPSRGFFFEGVRTFAFLPPPMSPLLLLPTALFTCPTAADIAIAAMKVMIAPFPRPLSCTHLWTASRCAASATRGFFVTASPGNFLQRI